MLIGVVFIVDSVDYCTFSEVYLIYKTYGVVSTPSHR
jgi:hypothetical protein